MNRLCYLLAAVSAGCVVFLCVCPATLGTHHTQVQAVKPSIEGLWIEVSTESEGRFVSSLPGPFGYMSRSPAAEGSVIPIGPVYIVWNISKDYIEKGDTHAQRYYLGRFSLRPGKETNTLDITRLDPDGQPITNGKTEAIFLLKDDYLIICHGEIRPERFSTNGAPKSTSLVVLRRGQHEGKGSPAKVEGKKQ